MDQLTRRQRTIAKLVSRGLTSREIADQLHISRRTVEVHRANIKRRMANGKGRPSDPLKHPAVQKIVRRLSARVAMLATELAELKRLR